MTRPDSEAASFTPTRRTVVKGLAAGVAGYFLVPAASAEAAAREPVFRGEVPTLSDVLGVDFADREITAAEAGRYVEAVAAVSPRVMGSSLGTSWSGQSIPYALVGRPDRLTGDALARIRDLLALLRDPSAPAARVAAAAHVCPAVVWLAAGVHGTERSGTNAVLRIMYELADRSDAEATALLDALLLVVVPVQNPDGHDQGERGNYYGFDLNRDWFAATQAETPGKLALLGEYPPVTLLDLHEMEGDGYFFPPYREPIHPEVPAAVRRSIDDVYGPAMAERFRALGFDFVTGAEFDLYHPGMADTATALRGLGAGITLEKGHASALADRVAEHREAAWAVVAAVAARRVETLGTWHHAHREAVRQGRDGVVQGVPGVRVRNYFLAPPTPATEPDLHRLVHRLQLAGVRVYRLSRPHHVPDLRPFGGTVAGPAVLDRGSYWIPLAQAGKHWVQALLSDVSHAEGPTFSDVTCWSLPLFANLAGGASALDLRLDAEPCPVLPAPPSRPPDGALRVGILRMSSPLWPIDGSLAWLRFRIEQTWRLPFQGFTPFVVTPERLREVDVLLVPDGEADFCHQNLGEAGRAALVDWVRAGGRFIGWRAATRLAVLLGISGVRQAPPGYEAAGVLIRVQAAAGGLLASVHGSIWHFCQREPVLYPADPGHVALSFPDAGSARWFVSGFQLGAEQLAGSAALTLEPCGDGDVLLFAGEPDFRGLGDAMAKVLLDGIRGAGLASRPAEPSAAARRAARRAVAELPASAARYRVTVADGEAAAVAAVLAAQGIGHRRRRCGAAATTFELLGPARRDHGPDPAVQVLPALLARAGVVPAALVTE
ncbi:M14 family zinc carboxypeptidase [Plantactinospora sp. CA-290183]|uniref:M14 family zinc carboxypeptidase n=1 Tax=Plantactinospora sp. CA-290183 TaxID=3240006 RepID=UPI003D91B5FD